ncbi:sialidase family protein [Methylomonas methanica]|uniref:exo-alpha-sialidase n=1 Tax=Methylomonas methanica (strain DSM 25384 / MC09) TaxID=857087 RepID=G0A0H1_METMM|nr:sialidase family protein [Methylomonas methanica]AEF98747.1 BNR repeat-containing protein [Methylomonas methanica MC09]
MTDLKLRKVHKFLLVLLVLTLSACGRSLNRQNSLSPVEEVAFVSPLTQQFAGRNLLSFDVYAADGTLHALVAVETAKPKQPYIGYLNSGDGGLNWSSPVDVGQYAAGTVESGAGNDVQIAAYGTTLIAIWQLTGEIPGMGPLQVVYSQDGGQSWLPGTNPTGSTVDQSHPDLVADQAGRFHLVWLDDRDENGYQGLRYARSSSLGRQWELAQTIDDSTCSCCWNRLSLGLEGELNALYRDMEPRDMALARSSDAGKTWRRISTVGEFNWIFDGCPHNGGALVLGGAGTWHGLVWTGAENKAGLYYVRSADNGNSWSKPQAMGKESLAFHSDIAVIGEEHLLAIWDAMGPDGSVVMISESFDQGINWSSARQISAQGNSATFPRVVKVSSGALAMWIEQKPGEAKQWVAALLK